MSLKDRFERAKQKLLTETAICPDNRRLFLEFFKYEEYKLKRTNGLRALDDSCFRTLLDYVTRLRTVNRWFQNKPWTTLTKTDIKRVYDDLEDGKILNRFGRPLKDPTTYYNHIMRSKPFAMAGKKAIVDQVMEFAKPRRKEQVRFINEDTFRKLVDVMTKPEHRLLVWLCFDIGENVSSVLELRAQDCVRRTNPDTNTPEYRINLRCETLKRSRRPRSELTNYTETVQYLDQLLEGKESTDRLFAFGYRQAKKIVQRAVRLTDARCIPDGQPVSLKDLRSSMACDLLSKGWTTDEVNARLGHKPSSRELDKYVNFLALDRHRPKKKLHDNQIEKLAAELEKVKQRERLSVQRQESLKEELALLKQRVADNNVLIFEEVQRVAARLPNTKPSGSLGRGAKAGRRSLTQSAVSRRA